MSGEIQTPEEKKWGEPPSREEQPINEPLTAEETHGLKQHVREIIDNKMQQYYDWYDKNGRSNPTLAEKS